MKYYKKGENNCLDLSHIYLIGQGSFGKVYAYGRDECIKLLNDDAPIDVDVLEEIKNLHLHHYDAIKDIVYREDGKVGGYIMNRYHLMLPDFYSMKVKEFLRIFNSLRRDCDTLSEHKIFINDSSARNTMYYKNMLKIVDYDLYRKSNSPKLRESNYKLLLWLWHDLFIKQRIINGYQNIIQERIIEPFFNPSSGDIKSVKDKLLEKEYVIDSFMRG